MQPLWTPWRMAYLRRSPAGGQEGCILCGKYAANEDEQSLIVYRSQHSFIMLNLYPYNNGHVMVVPTRHVASPELLSEEELLDLMRATNLSIAALRRIASPDGFNVGYNLGRAAGAGIEEHMHVHVVPRWQGDTNFMPILAQTRVIPELLPQTWRAMRSAIHDLIAFQGGSPSRG
jgi:ATP adenylyltransferase